MANPIPRLTNLDPVLTFAENAVNAAPALIDTDVSFTDADFAGGVLRVTGLLAEDRVALAQDTGVTLDGSTVRFFGIEVGTLLGGVGADLTITLNPSANAGVVERLIEHLTYQTVSDTPSASRTLSITVTDTAGAVSYDPSRPRFSAGFAPDARDPFVYIDVGLDSRPALGDLNGDGYLDLIVGNSDGRLRTYRRFGYDDYREQFDAANPFTGFQRPWIAPALGDLDGDGDLDLVIGDRDGYVLTFLRGANGAYTELGGAANPFKDVNRGKGYSTPALGDLDGDGDLDLVVGNLNGTVQTYLRGADGAYTQQIGTANPFNGISVGLYGTTALGDLDGDGDLDLVVGTYDGDLQVFLRGADGTYTAQTGAANPFGGIDVGEKSAPVLGDLDRDGDLDLVVGAQDGTVRTYINTPLTPQVLITVTAQDDAVVAVDDSGTVVEEGTVVLNVLGNDTYVNDPVKSLAAVKVAPEQGSARIVNGQVVFTAAKDFNGIATLTYTLSNGSFNDEGQALVTVTPVNDVPVLAGLTQTLALLENAVNAAPALIDADVTFTDTDFAGGVLRVTGLLAEDRVALAQDAGVNLDGTTVRVAGIVVGNLSGGVGADLTITLNPSASAATVEALIEHLTYRTASDTPSASRTLSITVTDTAGAVTQGLSRPRFSTAPDAANPFAGIDVDTYGAPALVDLDRDGDLDLVVGANGGMLQTYLRVADGTYTQQTDAANPFNGIDVGGNSTPALGDLDGDGDVDLVVGSGDGTLRTYLRGADGTYTLQTDAANPFGGIDVGIISAPALGDLDGDGDLDLVVGEAYGTLRTYLRGADGTYTAQTGAANPFNGIVVSSNSTPALGDLDGDGDLDLVVGSGDGTLRTHSNTTLTPQVLTTVTAQQDRTVVNATATVSTKENTASSAVAIGAYDPDGTLLSYGMKEGDAPLHGSVSFDQAAGTFIYTPTADYSGTDRFTISVFDEQGGTAQQVVTVTVNDAPVARDDAGTVKQGASVTLDVLANDTDVNGDTLSLRPGSLVVDPAQGTAAILDGRLVFTAAADFLGAATVAYTVVDGAGPDALSASGRATITVTSFYNEVTGRDGVDDALTGTAEADWLRGFSGNDTLLGLGGDDRLQGGPGDDRLDGGLGADTMLGGLGDDTYLVDDLRDVVTELVDRGVDAVRTPLSTYTLGDNVEALTATGSGFFTGTGNALANLITGGDRGNRLDGGAGADTLVGGLGADTYLVDNASDAVVERPGGGTDRVLTSVSYMLGDNVENLALGTSASINGTGNALANQLVGNKGNNALDGRGGADTMVGGLGNDTYVVDNAGDIVTELAGEGFDTVRTSLSAYTLGDTIEALSSTGTGFFTGAGNALANLITGGDRGNRLDGGAGADTMLGGLGNDTYIIDNAADVVVEQAGGGVDRVLVGVSYTLGDNVENLGMGTSASLSGTGNALANLIVGNNGNNVLDGRGGADTLTGGLGRDTFLLRAGETQGDTVTDFVRGTDTLAFYGFGTDAVLSRGAGSDLYTVASGDGLTSGSFRLTGVSNLDLSMGTANTDARFFA